MTMRIYFRVLGGHTHLRVFTAIAGRNLGLAGHLTMTNEEFAAWKGNKGKLEFIDESKL